MFNTKFYICSKQDKKHLQHFMTTSVSITKISAALVKAQHEMSNAVKGATNPFFKKTYADINSVREAVMPALNKHGITAIQPTCVVDGVDYVETVLLHESGEYISSLTRIVVDKVNDAQRHGSGLSYARRYALQSICNIGASDDDGNAATDKKEVKPALPATKLPTHNDHVRHILAISTVEELKEYKAKMPADMLKDKGIHNAFKDRYEQLNNKGVTNE